MTRYYSEPQLELLRIIRLLGCLDVRQARLLCRMRFGLSQNAFSTLIRQLRNDGKVFEDKQTRCLLAAGHRRDIHIVRAVDIALAFAADDNPPRLLRSEKPCILLAVFAKQDMQMQVFHAPPGKEQAICKKLNDAQIDVNLSTFFVLLLDEAAQSRFVQTTQSCLIAFPDETGRIVLQKNHSLEGEMKNGQRENAGMVGTSS